MHEETIKKIHKALEIAIAGHVGTEFSYGQSVMLHEMLYLYEEQRVKNENRIAELEEKLHRIPVSERKPKALQRVLCTVKRGNKTTREICVYTPPKTVLADNFIDDDWVGDESCTEYDEENDCYWTVEGWWETSYEADMSYKITGEVIDWMEIP